ncbi:TonB-dependent receptor [Asticcacaulis taihuensis]|uniref:TonB-dependent receptor n=1 Tax=Asticcacaulis taihuensis TaxID=260084 RepID=UPI0026E9B7B2|nr:carboxypeptidase regulatory-like domain-containing protein [Asticcacaulis taihuensis]
MKKLSLRSGLLATTTICGAALSTMAGGALVATVATMLPTVAQAQDYTSGAVVVDVTDPSGAPVAGATVTLTSKSQGIVRTISTNATGSATATGLVPGEYDVAVTANGFDDYSGTATIVVSQSVTYTYALNTTGAAQTIVVKGKRVRQDFNKTTAGLSVDLTTLTAQQPIGRSIEAVTLLAPTTVRSDAFGAATIGGGSAGENAYYINGLNITNPDTYVGGAQVPFDFYKTVDTQTSGYQAEFGRATGGVVNATTKNGTNNFMFAVHGNFAPNSLRSPDWDLTADPAKYKSSDSSSLVVESGGALIKDKLFLYGLVQFNDTKSTYASTSGGFYQVGESKDPFYGLKADWYITPKHHLELTYFDTTSNEKDTRYNYSGTLDDGSDGVIGTQIENGKRTIKTGGENWVAKYTGTLTDWFTISAEYGISKDSDDVTPENTSLNYAEAYDYNTGLAYRLSSTQPYSSISTDDTERKFFRLDGDLRFSALGKHHVRFGYDNEDLSMTKTYKMTGDVPVLVRLYGYYNGADHNEYGQYVPGSPTGWYPSYYDQVSGTNSNTFFPRARLRYESLGGKVSGQDSAFYIQDSWDVTPLLNLQIGLRDDIFKQTNLSGEQYLDLKDNFAPRLGFSWKPSEDSKWRFTGFYGQYFIPPAMNLGFRGKDLYFYERWGAPTGGWQLGVNVDPVTGLPSAYGSVSNPSYPYSSLCPTSDIANLPGNPVSTAGASSCIVYGAGAQEPSNAKAAQGLKATRESEITLASHFDANDMWSFGLTYVHRTLDRVSEDTDFAPYIVDYCTNVLHVDCSAPYPGNTYGYGGTLPEYHVWNVGDSITFRTFYPLPGQTEQSVITLTGLGFEKPKRTYDALTLDFKRKYDGKWGLQGSYTYSRSYGNYEGTTYTFGGGDDGQTDAGSTQLYDYKGLTDYATGLLPNDRTHQFKVWGSYSITPEFSVGANIAVISPQHLSCMGVHPTDQNAAGYGSSSHYCWGQPAPMGKGPKTDWTKQVDLALRYTMPQAYSLGGTLVLRADIFNLFDQKMITGRDTAADDGSDYTYHNPNYGNPTSYAAPRYMRLGFDITY